MSFRTVGEKSLRRFKIEEVINALKQSYEISRYRSLPRRVDAMTRIWFFTFISKQSRSRTPAFSVFSKKRRDTHTNVSLVTLVWVESPDKASNVSAANGQLTTRAELTALSA